MYDDTSFYGDLICEEYNSQNNFMNPPTPLGYFLYTIIGGGFDQIQERINQFNNNISILSCEEKYLNIYGRYWNIPRPTINNRLLTDEEYRVYLYLKKCRLITIQDLKINFNKCLSLDDYDVKISQVEVNKLQVVDHESYTGSDDYTSSNLKPNTEDFTLNKIVNHNNEEEVNKFSGHTGHSYQLEVVVEIPSQNWDKYFLKLLTSFISLKGNVEVKEYNL